MGDCLAITVRFGLYLDLMLLFGVPLFTIRTFRRNDRALIADMHFDRLLPGLAGFGIVLSLVGMAVMAKAMSGAEDYAAMGRHVYEMVIVHTDVGIAWLVRMGALMVAISAPALLGRMPTQMLPVIAAMGAVALSSLAWAGHGAMDEGARGYLHLSIDILHLAAAAVWVGALAIFVLLSLRTSLVVKAQVELFSRILKGFASTGTFVVVTLILTGSVNYWLINGWAPRALASTLYGVLLLFKLSLFVLMLALAAANRYHLSPGLEAALRDGSVPRAMTALRRSLAVELTAATTILGLVSWLGTLSPTAAFR
jgi:putative copper resistance protein D